MKKLFAQLLSAVTFAALFSPLANARVGEPKTAFEGRMLSKTNGAYLYSSPEDRFREAMELPYKYNLLLLPKDAISAFYFKRLDEASATNSDVIQQNDLIGWEIHAIFQNGKSVMEFYSHYGNAMTIEELEGLMQIVAKQHGGTYWTKSPFVSTNDRIDLYFNGKDIVRSVANRPLKPDEKPTLKDILPLNKNRFIYVDVPEDFKNSTAYGQSIQAKIMEDEQQRAHDAYNKLLEQQAQIRADKTQRDTKKTKKSSNTSSTVKINKFYGNPFKSMESLIFLPNPTTPEMGRISILKYDMQDYLFGGRPPKNRDREIRIPLYIPLQPDTSLGFDYVLSDGSVRAKLYKEGILFISSKFDKDLRADMEKLFEAQSKIREKEAEGSLSKF